MIEIVKIDNVVVGAGVVGLSIAAEMSRQGLEVYVLESQSQIGSGISSRNSEVIHSGIYYPKNSFRAKFCVSGSKKLYSYCHKYDIPHKQCGKLVVATNKNEIIQLERIYARGQNNGVNEIYFLNVIETNKRAPQISAVSSLFIPDTGIIDSHSYMNCLAKEIESSGGKVMLNHSVVGGSLKPDDFVLLIQTNSQIFKLQARRLIIAAGLFSHKLCASLEGYKLDLIPPLHLVKGNYFSYIGREKFDHLIYPVPVTGGLGTHLTFDMAGSIRFGPDVEWLENNDPSQVNYSVDESRVKLFYNSIRQYWPGISEGSLLPSYSGVRPKLYGPEEEAADFMIDSEETHRIGGLVILFGIESPGLTSSLEIGDYVTDILLNRSREK